MKITAIEGLRCGQWTNLMHRLSENPPDEAITFPEQTIDPSLAEFCIPLAMDKRVQDVLCSPEWSSGDGTAPDQGKSFSRTDEQRQ